MDETKQSEFTIKNPKTDEILIYCYLHDELLDGKVQIHLETPYDVYDGPVEYLNICSERK